jgi:hypothetical protein
VPAGGRPKLKKEEAMTTGAVGQDFKIPEEELSLPCKRGNFEPNEQRYLISAGEFSLRNLDVRRCL